MIFFISFLFIVLLFFIVEQFTISYEQNYHASNYDMLQQQQLIEKDTIANFTILVYVIGSDMEDKYQEATKDLKEMLKAHLVNPNVNVVVQTGGSTGYGSHDNKLTDFSSLKRHVIVNSTLLTLNESASANMGDSKTLHKFLEWGISNYPAQKYGLILWDHGTGVGGFGMDINFDNDKLSLPELRDALRLNLLHSNFNGFEFIGFDSCLMATIEVASILAIPKPIANFLIASQEIEPNWGWNYTSLLNFISNNVNATGEQIGKEIISSYVADSERISQELQFSAERDITLSVIKLHKISTLNQQLDNMLKPLKTIIKDTKSLSNLIEIIDTTENYGRSTDGGYGMIDLKSFLINLESKLNDFRSYDDVDFANKMGILSNLIAKTKLLLDSVIVANYHGESHTHSNGLSIYLPLSKDDFLIYREIIKQGIPFVTYSNEWLLFIHNLNYLVHMDKESPIIKSQRFGNIIKTHVIDTDINEIFVNFIIKDNSSKPVRYVQKLENLIDKDGFYSYDSKKMLQLCNESMCMPVSMKLEESRDFKRIFIPVTIKNELGENPVSLIYEVKNETFIFLGGKRDGSNTNGDPIAKEKISFKRGDQLFSKGYEFKISTRHIDFSTKSDKELIFSNTEIKDSYLTVYDPTKIVPKFTPLNQATLYLDFCDLSENCFKTRYYDISEAQKSDFKPIFKSSFIFGLSENSSKIVNYPKNLYLNKQYGFQLSYPSDWMVKTIDFNNTNTFLSYLNDNSFLSFYSIENIIKNHGDSPSSPKLTLQIEDTRHYPITTLFNYFNSYSAQDTLYKLNIRVTDSNETQLNGNPAIEFIMDYILPNDLFVLPEKKVYYFSTIVKDRYYNFVFESGASNFYKYLPTIKKIINSFQPYSSNIQELKKMGYVEINEDEILQKVRSTLNNNLLNDSYFIKYIDPKFNFTINYYYNDELNKFNNRFLNDNNYVSATAVPYPLFDFDSPISPVVTVTIINSTDISDNEGFLLKKLYSKRLDDVVGFSFSFLFLVKDYFDYKLYNSDLIIVDKNITAVSDEQTFFSPLFHGQIKEKRVYTVIDGKFVMISIVTSPKSFSQYEPVFDKMVNSFHVNSPVVNPSDEVFPGFLQDTQQQLSPEDQGMNEKMYSSFLEQMRNTQSSSDPYLQDFKNSSDINPSEGFPGFLQDTQQQLSPEDEKNLLQLRNDSFSKIIKNIRP